MEFSEHLRLLLGLGTLLCFSAFFSGSETALCALSRVQIERLRSEAKKSSLAIVHFVDDPRRLFITILLGNVIVNIAFSTLTAALIYGLFAGTAEVAGASGAAVAVATFSITIFLLIFGEITPKSYAIRNAEGFARITARPLWAFSVLITPARALLRWVTNLLLPLFGGGGISPQDQITADDFRAAVSVGEASVLQPDERQMLDKILQLRDIEANEVMVPRVDMIAMSASSTIDDVLKQAKTAGVSRIPIYRERIENICGIFHVKDLPLWNRVDLRRWTIEEFLERRLEVAPKKFENTLVRPPFFTFEKKKLTDLFAELTREKTKIAILLDEYGGIAGSVSLEDIVEQVVGDILDEHDRAPRADEIVPDPENPLRIHVAGRASVREINQRFQLRIDEGLADTIAGYVFSLFGRVPSVGEAKTDRSGVRFEVVATQGNSITGMVMTLPERGGGSGLLTLSILLGSSVLLIGAASPTAAAEGSGSALSRIGILFALMLLTLVLRAFYAGSETALVSLNKSRIARLAEEGDRRAEIIRNLVRSPEKMLGMTLIGTNLMSVVISQINLLLVWAVLQHWGAVQSLLVETLHLDATMIATVLTTLLILIFGEILAKTIFRVKANQLALRYAYALRVSDFVLLVGTRFVTILTTLLVRLMSRESQPVSPEEARSELRLLARMGERSGNIMTDQRRMIHSVLNLYRRNVEHVMRPLVDFVAVDEDTDRDRFLQIAAEAGHSRIPVYQGRIYNIVGIVNLLDVIYSGRGEPAAPQTIRPFIRRDPLFVPESKPIRELLTQIQGRRNAMAFVVDEYGGVVGLVTIEDLVEEIVGDVADERDPPDHIRVIGPRTLESDGRAEVDRLAEEFGMPIPSGDYETISGYVLDRLRAIPKPGDQIDVDDRFTLTITKADSRGIRSLRIQSRDEDFIRRSPDA